MPCFSKALAYEFPLSKNPIMDKNFSVCPHCAAKGKQRWIQPATPQRTPLVSRSDGSRFISFLKKARLVLCEVARTSKSQPCIDTISIHWESKESRLWFLSEYLLLEATWLVPDTKKQLID